MIHVGSEGLPTRSSDIRPEVLHRIQIGQVYTPLIGMLALNSKLLDIHSKEAHLDSFNFLKE
jgi:hypothetical protein